MRTVLSSGDDSLASFLPTTLLLNPISYLLLFVSWLLLWLYISVGDTCTFSDFLFVRKVFIASEIFSLVWKQLEQHVKTTYFLAAQLRGFIKCGRVRPHTKKVVFNKLFPFLKSKQTFPCSQI